VIMWEVFVRLQAHKNLPHDHMSPPAARSKQSHCDL